MRSGRLHYAWVVTAVTFLALLAAEFSFTGSAVALGIFADLVSRTSPLFAAPLPVGTLTGVGIMLAVYALRRFTHRRLIGGLATEPLRVLPR